MDIQIKTHNLKLNDDTREYIEKRVAKLDKVNERIIDAKFEVRREAHHNPTQKFIAQFTIATKQAVLRAEERNSDITTAVDLVTDKMARRIRRYHERRTKRVRRSAVGLGQLAADQLQPEATAMDGDAALDDVDADVEVVVRTKRFNVMPMDTAEAIEQMELLGHDFFVFYNPDNSRMSVLYRRQDGGFGVLEPELA